jgi:hypothetical protein
MRFLLCHFLLLGISLNLFAQTNHLTSLDGGFENSASFSGNGWTVVNSSVNTWVIGSNAGAASGTNSAYLSNNGGSFVYSNNISQTSHFYKDFTIPATESMISLSFKIKCIGEPFFDRLLVYTAPTTLTPIINSPLSSSSTLTGATLI